MRLLDLLKKRRTAAAVTVAAAVLALIFGVHKSVNALARGVEDMFTDGVNIASEGYTEPGIGTHLGNGAEAALGLATILQDRAELKTQIDELTAARRALLAEESISGKAEADAAMVDAFAELVYAAKELELTERETDAIAQFTGTFTGAHISASNSRYNSMVEKYYGDVSPLADLILSIAPVRAPEAYDQIQLPPIEFP